MSDTSRFHALQRDVSREATLDALERLLERVDDPTFSQIAQEAGVSERTVYRAFPTKEQLWEGFWDRLKDTLQWERASTSWAEYLASRPQVFAQMDRKPHLMRALSRSAQAKRARLETFAERRSGIRKVVTDRVGALPEPELTELCALVHLLGSASAWSVMKDFWGIDGERAGLIVSRALATILDASVERKDNK